MKPYWNRTRFARTAGEAFRDASYANPFKRVRPRQHWADRAMPWIGLVVALVVLSGFWMGWIK